MCSKFQYGGVVSNIILKEDILQLCLKIAGLETKCLQMRRLGSRDKANPEVSSFRLTSTSWKV